MKSHVNAVKPNARDPPEAKLKEEAASHIVWGLGFRV